MPSSSRCSTHQFFKAERTTHQTLDVPRHNLPQTSLEQIGDCSVVVMQRKPGEGRFTFLYQIGACSEEIQSRLGTPHQDLLASISEGLPALWPVDVSSAARLNTSTYCQRRLVEEVMARKRLVSTGQRA